MKEKLLGLLSFFAIVFAAGEALAYVGPGAGISALGSLLAVVAAVALAIIGFVWYPVKRLKNRLRQKPAADSRGWEAEEEVR